MADYGNIRLRQIGLLSGHGCFVRVLDGLLVKEWSCYQEYLKPGAFCVLSCIILDTNLEAPYSYL